MARPTKQNSGGQASGANRGTDECRGKGSDVGPPSITLADVLAAEEQRKRVEALAELDRARTAFLSNVGHEFRTHLMLLLGPLQDLLARPGAALDAGDLGALEEAHRNALHLQKLVNALLDFSRSEVARVQPGDAHTDPADSRRLRDRFQRDNLFLRQENGLDASSGEIIGRSAAIKKVLSQVEQVAGTGSTVLLLGETGTGKELLARAIHGRSPRHPRPMVTLNCAALPATLIESELFGREKGAYTGALTGQAGRFEQADGSTLFLDEISEMPLEMQAKLLRVLQEGRFERLGGPRTIQVDVRLITATNRDLARAMTEGKFRNDLYYRLNVFPIRLPPLRERREDIPLLVWAFVKELAPAMGKTIEAVPPASLEALRRYDWPGNVRELRNVIERALIVCPGPVLHAEPPQAVSPANEEAARAQTLEDVERRHIRSVLERTGWRVSGRHGAAEVLGLKPTTLESRMAKLGIKRER
jgi:transcriptional regulator with GAF, ATPase, and Fis domain